MVPLVLVSHASEMEVQSEVDVRLYMVESPHWTISSDSAALESVLLGPEDSLPDTDLSEAELKQLPHFISTCPSSSAPAAPPQLVCEFATPAAAYNCHTFRLLCNCRTVEVYESSQEELLLNYLQSMRQPLSKNKLFAHTYEEFNKPCRRKRCFKLLSRAPSDEVRIWGVQLLGLDSGCTVSTLPPPPPTPTTTTATTTSNDSTSATTGSEPATAITGSASDMHSVDVNTLQKLLPASMKTQLVSDTATATGSSASDTSESTTPAQVPMEQVLNTFLQRRMASSQGIVPTLPAVPSAAVEPAATPAITAVVVVEDSQQEEQRRQQQVKDTETAQPQSPQAATSTTSTAATRLHSSVQQLRNASMVQAHMQQQTLEAIVQSMQQLAEQMNVMKSELLGRMDVIEGRLSLLEKANKSG